MFFFILRVLGFLFPILHCKFGRTLILSSSCTVSANPKSPQPIPKPTIDIPASLTKGKQTAILAGGCFWGMEAVFEHLKGVDDVVSGFSGGIEAISSDDHVSSRPTEQAESIKITYDPTQISYGQLLEIYFSVAHDPTQLNRQGPDVGKQYRSAIFFTTSQQKQVAQAYIEQLNQSLFFQRQIVTELVPFTHFQAAAESQQNFLINHPNHPYIVINDLPKLEQLKKHFPHLYKP